MRLKLFFGIILPILIIISLAILGSLGPGFETKIDFNENIAFKDLFRTNYNSNALRIGEITVKNDYFLPKRYEAPAFIVCAKDNDNIRPMKNVGYIFYNEGEYSEDTKYAELNSLSYMSRDYYGYGYNYGNYKTSVELEQNSAKKLQIYFSSNQYNYNYNYDTSNSDYDELIIVEQNSNNKLSCETLSLEEQKESNKISISKDGINPGYCPESGIKGVIDKAINFDGLDDYISGYVDSSNAFSTDKITISFWMNQTERVPEKNIGIISLGPSSSYGQKYVIQFARLNNQNLLFTDAINPSNNIFISDEKMPQLNRWNHVVFVVDGQSYSYYLNGKLMTTGIFNTYFTSSIDSLQLGRRSDIATGYYSGSLDELMIWNTALNSDEVIKVYEKNYPELIDWPFLTYSLNQDKNSTTFYDSSFNSQFSLSCTNVVSGFVNY